MPTLTPCTLHAPLMLRLQAKDAMQHPYFNDFPERDIGERLGECFDA